jgi:hypothetical protein
MPRSSVARMFQERSSIGFKLEAFATVSSAPLVTG